MEVPKTYTPQSIAGVWRLLRDAFWARFGSVPSATTLALAAGVVGLETGGGRFIVQNNFGNIMAGPGWGGAYWPRPTSDPRQPTRFRAYPTAVDGASDFWATLARNHRGALAAMAQGDASAVTAELYRSSYVVGGNARAYRDGVAHWARQVSGRGWVLPIAATVAALGVVGVASRMEARA